MEGKNVKVTIGYHDFVMPFELAVKLLACSDKIYKINTYTKSTDEILEDTQIEVTSLPNNFEDIVAGAKAMGTSYNDYKNNSQ